MPVNYRKDMVTVGDFGGNIWRILCRWQGSVYKLVFIDLACWLGIYFAISVLYRFILGPVNKARFASFVDHCNGALSYIPLSWILGFFVGLIVKRWWDQFQQIPWPDSISYYVYAAFPEQDESSRMSRRTIVRWVNLTITMVLLKMIEPNKPLETKDDFIQEGLMTPNEKMILEDFERKTSKCRELDHKAAKSKCTNTPSFIWPIPLTWALNLVRKARKEKKIEFDKLAEILVNELVKLRAQCEGLLAYDLINVPLVYTQVVTIALYSYFLICLLARQFTPSPDQIDIAALVFPENTAYDKWSSKGGSIGGIFEKVDYYIPVFTILQFIFYVGWLKVAEVLMNPFGNDDDDFDILFLLKRNKEAAYLIVDEMGVNPPEAQKDKFWNREISKFCSEDKANEAMPPVQDMGGPPRTPDMRHPGMAPPRTPDMRHPMGVAPMGHPGGMGGPHGGMMPGMRPPMNPPRPPMGGHAGDDQQPLYQNF